MSTPDRFEPVENPETVALVKKKIRTAFESLRRRDLTEAGKEIVANREYRGLIARQFGLSQDEAVIRLEQLVGEVVAEIIEKER